MSTMEKMQVLSDMAQYDLCDKVSDFKKSQVNLPGIYHACGANGCQVPQKRLQILHKPKQK